MMDTKYLLKKKIYFLTVDPRNGFMFHPKLDFTESPLNVDPTIQKVI